MPNRNQNDSSCCDSESSGSRCKPKKVKCKRGEKGERGRQGCQGEKGEKGERGRQGERGEQGRHGERGERGEPGCRGERGEPGCRGPTGPMGPKGEHGCRGERGVMGPRGFTGPTGPSGPQGPPGLAPSGAEFYAFQSSPGVGDNSTITPGNPVAFPRDGIQFGAPGTIPIRNNTGTRFMIPTPGIYKIDLEVNITTDGGIGQLIYELNGVELPNTVVGNVVGNASINDSGLINVTIAGSVLRIIVPSGNPTNGTADVVVTAIAGGYSVPASTLRIIRIA